MRHNDVAMSAPEQTDAAPPADPGAEEGRAAVAAAVRAFTVGDFATTRRQLRSLRERDLPPEVRAQVDDLWRRTGADPVAVAVTLGAAILFLVVVYLTYWR